MNFSEFYSYINKLKIKQTQLEKCESDSVKYIKNNYDAAVENEYLELKTSREQDRARLQEDIKQIVFPVREIKSKISEKNLENLDLPTLKMSMLLLQNNIKLLKNRVISEQEQLKKNEIVLGNELAAVELRLAEQNKSATSVIKTCSRKNMSSEEYLFQEVRDFANFISKSGGQEGGWSEDDHLIYLKVYNRYKNKDKVIGAVKKLLPDISEEIILEHHKWYTMYLDLRNKQKEAIQKWRLRKITTDQLNNKQKSEETVVKSKPIITKDENRDVIKEKLEHWKLEKEQKIQKLQEESSQTSTKSKLTAKQRKIKQLEIKREIEQWKNAKETRDKAEKLEKEIVALRERERRISEANKLIKEFQSQDDLYINRRLARVKVGTETEYTSNPRQKNRQENRPFTVPRDPQRLLKPTRQWIARISPDESGGGDNINSGPASVKHIPKLYEYFRNGMECTFFV